MIKQINQSRINCALKRKWADLNMAGLWMLQNPSLYIFNPATVYWCACTMSGKWVVMYLCVSCIDVLHLSTILTFDFWNCSHSAIIFVFHFAIWGWKWIENKSVPCFILKSNIHATVWTEILHENSVFMGCLLFIVCAYITSHLL
jgi:hypothetical protein